MILFGSFIVVHFVFFCIRLENVDTGLYQRRRLQDIDSDDENKTEYLENKYNTSDVCESKNKKLPDWFRDGPFIHHSKLMLTFLPGFLLMFSVGGDT